MGSTKPLRKNAEFCSKNGARFSKQSCRNWESNNHDPHPGSEYAQEWNCLRPDRADGARKNEKFLLLREQHQDRMSPSQHADMDRDVERGQGRGDGFQWIRCAEVTFLSVYIAPNDSPSAFRKTLDTVEDEIRSMDARMIVAGHFNTGGQEQGMTQPDSRGRHIFQMARTRHIVPNIGSTLTFRNPGYEGIISLLCCTQCQ